MICSFLWLFSHVGALCCCKHDTKSDSFRILPVAPQLYRPCDLLFGWKHQRRGNPGTPCNIKLIIFYLIKTLSGWCMCVFCRSHLHSLLKNKSTAFPSDEYISKMDHLALFFPYHLCSHTTKEHWNIEEYTARLYRLSLSSFTHEKALTMLANHSVLRVRLSSWNHQEQEAIPAQMATLLKECNPNVG